MSSPHTGAIRLRAQAPPPAPCVPPIGYKKGAEGPEGAPVAFGFWLEEAERKENEQSRVDNDQAPKAVLAREFSAVHRRAPYYDRHGRRDS